MVTVFDMLMTNSYVNINDRIKPRADSTMSLDINITNDGRGNSFINTIIIE